MPLEGKETHTEQLPPSTETPTLDSYGFVSFDLHFKPMIIIEFLNKNPVRDFFFQCNQLTWFFFLKKSTLSIQNSGLICSTEQLSQGHMTRLPEWNGKLLQDTLKHHRRCCCKNTAAKKMLRNSKECCFHAVTKSETKTRMITRIQKETK